MAKKRVKVKEHKRTIAVVYPSSLMYPKTFVAVERTDTIPRKTIRTQEFDKRVDAIRWGKKNASSVVYA